LDICYFLERRLTFIAQYYKSAAPPFHKRKKRIEAGVEPFVPQYSEDGEPPYLEEWLEADESLQVLGETCLSMLSASLHLYFKAWVHQFGVPVAESLKSTFNNRGWFNGYKVYFESNFQIYFHESGCNLKLLEELVLARNRVQHPTSITSCSTTYTKDDLKKLQSPFFATDLEVELMNSADEGERSWLIPPKITVTEEKLQAVLTEVQRFAKWLEAVGH
jgi:hypothetical protein